MAKHPHRVRSKHKDLTRKTITQVKHVDFVGYFAGPGVFLNPKSTDLPEWPQENRVNWVKQRYLEHWKRQHENKPNPKECSHCQDYEIWLKLQNPRTSQRLLAGKMFRELKPGAALSKVYRAKERIETGVPSSRKNEGVFRCSCGKETVTLEELEDHKRSAHPDYEIERLRIEREYPPVPSTDRHLPTRLSEKTWSVRCSLFHEVKGQMVRCGTEILASTRKLVLGALKKHKRTVHRPTRRSSPTKRSKIKPPS